MTAVERGIVLDAELAALVPDGATVDLGDGWPWVTFGPINTADPNDILTHLGGHPVAELVAEADEAKERAKDLRREANVMRAASEAYPKDIDLRANADRLDAAADFLDRVAELLIDPALVAAAHAQWAEDEERGR